MEENEKNDSFLITPMNQHFYLKPGEVYEGSIKVVNPANSSADFKYEASVAPYGVVGKDYEADLTTESKWTEIAKWITIENNKGVLAPNETAYVNFTIRVPENAPPGAQSAAIVVTQDKDGKATEGFLMENIFEMASIIYGEVEWEVYQETAIISQDLPSFSDTPLISAKVVLENRGNVFEEANITISVKDLITGEAILPTATNAGEYKEIVVPESTREVVRNIDGLPFLGVVRIEQSIFYNNETDIISRDVWICPIWFMVLVGVLITVLTTTIVKIVKFHQRKKARYI